MLIQYFTDFIDIYLATYFCTVMFCGKGPIIFAGPSEQILKRTLSVLVSQLPEQVQPPMKEWLGREENAEITVPKGGEFLRKVKSLLLEKGFKGDHVFRNLGIISLIDKGMATRAKHNQGRDGVVNQDEDDPRDTDSAKTNPRVPGSAKPRCFRVTTNEEDPRPRDMV